MTNNPALTLDPVIQKRVDSWLNGAYDAATKEQIRTLLRENPKELSDVFYRTLSFGTGGMRGVMGVGTNRMNVYTVRAATQGLANYLLAQNSSGKMQAVFISYDSRHNSKEFALETAKVLAGNGIKAYLTRDLRPAPFVSFGCRYNKCQAGIMITASHNPPQYNGYKVYWEDGAQVLPPHDEGIVSEVEKIHTLEQVKSVNSIDHPLIQWVDETVDQAYRNAISTLLFYPEENRTHGNNLKIIYTSLHGTGITLVPAALKQSGFSAVTFVDAQIIPDGDFPTAPSPNPEEKEALSLGIQALQNTHADILLATDPDADRMGVVAMHEGKPYIFNGNQIACICLEHICQALTAQQKLDPKVAFVKTIVTTELFKAITERYETNCFDVLTGFKYIAELIRKWENEGNSFHYIFGGEESYGYLLGTFSRDKDAVVSCTLIAEIASKAKQEGKTLVDLLHDLYDTYGVYCERLTSVKYEESQAGHSAMQKAMQHLRQDAFTEIDDHLVTTIDDYLSLQRKDLKTGAVSPLTLPQSDVLVYWLDDGSKLMVRPSGTEPKVKVYCGVIEREFETIEQGEAKAEARAKEMLNAVSQLLKS